jgi:uncharacterized membrane protein
LNCDLVNRSTYSTVFGIPVALIGIMGYVALLALATLYRTKHEAPVMLLIASVAGLGTRALSHLRRSLRAGSVVHLMPVIAEPDFYDHRSVRGTR